MRVPQEFMFLVSAIVLSAGLSAGADLASARHDYQEKNYAAALQESTPLAEQGNADAQVLLGRMYLMGQGVTQDRDQAMKWFKAAAVQGNADAQFLLGSLLLLPQKDVGEGMKWLRLSADQGMRDAQYLLGKTYLQGIKDAPQDLVQAAMWLLLAAKGNTEFYQNELRSAEGRLTADQLAKAKSLAAEWKPRESPSSNERSKPVKDGSFDGPLL
jgi:TPR repeat protein